MVQVVVQDAEGRRAGSGTGFLVSKNGLIATNYHVIENAHSAFIILADETRLAVSGVAARDEKADIAILSVPYKVVSEPIELSTIEAPIGSKVYAIGNPLGLSNSLSDGIVSGYRESEGIRVIQTTAPISPGSSGGPLLSADGRVIGVTTFVFKGGQNLNFAVTNFHLKQQILKSNDRIEDAHFPLRNSSFAHEPRSNESTSPKRDSNEIDVTLDNPSSLISTEPKSIVVKGIRLGMTRQEVAKVLSTSEELMGVEDENNLSRVYVYHRNSDGSRGDAVLYLIWEPAETKMNRITVFQAYRGSLSKTFKRLLSFEAVDDKSSFKRDFVGYANRQKVTLNIPEIGLKHVTYYYDDLGLEITHKHGSRGDEVIFAIVQKAR